jgi:hypothetical protein
MREKTLFSGHQFSCQKKFTSDSWRLKHIKLLHSEHHQVVKNMTVGSASRRVEPTPHGELNINKDSVADLYSFPYLGHVENIADSLSQPPPLLLQRTDIYPGAGAPLSDYSAEAW